MLGETMEGSMTVNDIVVVAFVVSVFSAFGLILGWASWTETRAAKKNLKTSDTNKNFSQTRARAF
jgi:hypothetical protein